MSNELNGVGSKTTLIYNPNDVPVISFIDYLKNIEKKKSDPCWLGGPNPDKNGNCPCNDKAPYIWPSPDGKCPPLTPKP
jgi:hypothetical protein